MRQRSSCSHWEAWCQNNFQWFGVISKPLSFKGKKDYERRKVCVSGGDFLFTVIRSNKCVQKEHHCLHTIWMWGFILTLMVDIRIGALCWVCTVLALHQVQTGHIQTCWWLFGRLQLEVPPNIISSLLKCKCKSWNHHKYIEFCASNNNKNNAF